MRVRLPPQAGLSSTQRDIIRHAPAPVSAVTIQLLFYIGTCAHTHGRCTNAASSTWMVRWDLGLVEHRSGNGEAPIQALHMWVRVPPQPVPIQLSGYQRISVQDILGIYFNRPHP